MDLYFEACSFDNFYGLTQPRIGRCKSFVVIFFKKEKGDRLYIYYIIQKKTILYIYC